MARTRPLSPLLWLLAVVLGVLALAVHPASPSAAGSAGTRVGPSEQISATRTWVPAAESVDTQRGNRALYGGLVVSDLLATETTATDAEAFSAANATRLKTHLTQLEKYGQDGYRVLENGRFRYYGKLTPSAKLGTITGRRVVREWDPATGAKRTWMENVDGAGRVRIVRPETGVPKVHYVFDENGNFTGTF